MWIPFYHLLIYPVFVTVMRAAALWAPKIRRGLKGRTDWRGPVSRMRKAQPGEFRIHFHAASVGEFEQAKPIIEALRAEGRPYRITVSFFSPSGFEQQGGYPHIDGACYIPHDRQGEMSEFMNRISPDLIIIMRYDLWLEFLRQARLRNIPVVLACGVLRGNSARYYPLIRAFFERLYRQLTLAHCVGKEDAESIERLAPQLETTVTGDTRYDRVTARAQRPQEREWIPTELIAGRAVLVAGSTWGDDEELLREALEDRHDVLAVIVPHEPTEAAIARLLDTFPGAVTLTELEAAAVAERGVISGRIRCVIVDRTGILSGLYGIGDIAYVGGGFGAGVHSVLEPAAFGIPVFCGTKIKRSPDALGLRAEGPLTVVASGKELRAGLTELLKDRAAATRRGEAAHQFVRTRAGATARILESLRVHGYLPALEAEPAHHPQAPVE